MWPNKNDSCMTFLKRVSTSGLNIHETRMQKGLLTGYWETSPYFEMAKLSTSSILHFSKTFYIGVGRYWAESSREC